MPSTISRGQVARVRQRVWLVEDLVPPPRPGDSPLVRLSCVDDDNQGQPLEVLWDREIDAEVLSGEAWDAIARRGFDPPTLFAAYVNTLRWNCVTATDAKLFQAPFRAGIKLDAYQLEPLRKALLLPRVNLFIADDVGLGKTIEAGLIARELLLRKKVRDIVVACPPSMLYQWQDELDSRFGLTFEILDKEYMQRVRRERGFSINPWSTHSRFLVSHRLLIDENYTGPMLDWLGTFKPGSLLILDEAHHAAPASGQRYAIDSQITRAVRELAHRFEHRLFLSATPHNGHSNSFSALLEILDPQRFCRGVPVPAKHRDDVIVRRLKEDIREIQGGFPKRIVQPVMIEGLPDDAPELVLSRLLDEYRQVREQRLESESKRVQAAAGLLVTGLQQRLLSSIEAFARTLRVHRNTVQRQWEAATSRPASKPAPTSSPSLRQLDLLAGAIDSDDDRAELPEEQLQAEEDAQVEAASLVSEGSRDTPDAALFAREQALLERMAEIAEDARHRPDARVHKLLDWIRRQQCPQMGKPGAAWTEVRVLLFTEYDDTKRYLRQQLEAALGASDRADERIEVYHGPTPPAKREEIKKAFNTHPAQHPVRILIATDAAREGLNLQAHCWNLFHCDVPWNPSRMEQRNGRIDRKLQDHDEVYCHYFVYRQRPEDRILRALVRKTETIRRELGSLSQVIDAKISDRLKEGIRHRQIDALEHDIDAEDLDPDRRETVAQELDCVRDRQVKLRQQIETLRTQLDTSKQAIALEESQFRGALSSALELTGVAPLARAPDSPDMNQPARFTLPPIDQQQTAWADTIDTLRTPRPRDQRLWEWRREAPLRPVVFTAPHKMDDSVVHLHLEHRIVQRLLGRFTAQGFVHHDLSRACLAQTDDAIPRVVLLGRLCLYGAGAARLHEELVFVTARWIDPKIRKGPLSVYGRDAETRTRQLLEKSLQQPTSGTISAEIRAQLQASAPGDIRDLLPSLEARGADFAADATQKLQKRAEAEARAMREILETQQKHLVARREKDERDRQGRLAFDNAEEERQLEADRRHWEKRLTLLAKELADEPARVRQLYTVQAQRIEPIGLAYLWPQTG